MIIVNGEEIKFGKFPNNETIVPPVKSKLGNFIDFKYEEDGDLIKLMFIKRHLDVLGMPTSLRIYFMPYSQMDRSEEGSVFTLKYVAEFINNLNFLRVTIVEPHSDVSTALVNKSTAVYPTFEMLPMVEEEIGFDREKDFLFFPDAGAQKRYHSLRGYKQLVGFKDRDFKTGEIKGLEVVGVTEDIGKVIIMDDLCMKGGTFILAAEKLNALGFNEIYLLTAHTQNVIFKGEVLTSGLINKVFTTNTVVTEQDSWFNLIHKEKLEIFNVKDLI